MHKFVNVRLGVLINLNYFYLWCKTSCHVSQNFNYKLPAEEVCYTYCLLFQLTLILICCEKKSKCCLQNRGGGGRSGKGNTQDNSTKGVSFNLPLFSVVVVYYKLASGILSWTNSIVLQRWNIPANHTGEIHKTYRNANKRHRSRFSIFLAHAHIYIYFKDFLIFFNKFKLHDYVQMYMLITLALFQRTELQCNEKCEGV